MMKFTRGYWGANMSMTCALPATSTMTGKRNSCAASHTSRVGIDSMSVHLQATEAVASYSLAHDLAHASRIALRIHHREAYEPGPPSRHDGGELAIGGEVIGMERRKDNGASDSCASRATRIRVYRRRRIPGRRQEISTAGVTVKIDDHRRPNSSRKRTLVRIPRWKFFRLNLSFGPCRLSPGDANPINTVGMPSTRLNSLTTGDCRPDRTHCGSRPKTWR